jgi:hypothetical protein
MGLFTQSEDNTKLEKSVGSPYNSIGLFLSPHRENTRRVNLCPHASVACIAACLNTSGRAAVFPSILQARKRKTEEFLSDRTAFIEKLKKEIAAYDRQAKKQGKKLAVRLNGTSDIIYPPHLFDFIGVQFYDYTKNFATMRKFLAKKLPYNYHLTYSYSGENLRESLTVLHHGGNVAVVFSSDQFPTHWNNYPVVSGENSDLRFLDPSYPCVIGLKAKGRAKKQPSNFIIQIERRAYEI